MKYFPLLAYDKGIMLSKENAKRLIDDAKTLFASNRYASALYLGMQGLEEIGKALLFLEYKRKQKTITKSQWEKVFSCHTEKLKAVHRAITKHCMKIRFFEGSRNSKKYYPEKEVQKMIVDKWKQDKDKFAYVDYDFPQQKWSTPLKAEVIEFEGLVKGIVFTRSKMAFHALEEETKQK